MSAVSLWFLLAVNHLLRRRYRLIDSVGLALERLVVFEDGQSINSRAGRSRLGNERVSKPLLALSLRGWPCGPSLILNLVAAVLLAQFVP